MEEVKASSREMGAHPQPHKPLVSQIRNKRSTEFNFVCDRFLGKSKRRKIKHLMLIMSAYNKTDVHPLTFILVGIPGLEAAHSGFFLAMAFDRYVAICNPLRHSTILTHSVIGRMGLAIILRGTALLSPHPLLLSQFPYCRTNIISHIYCEFMALIKIACAETRILRAYSLIVAFLTGGVDLILIVCSYVLTLHTVFHLPPRMPDSRPWEPVAPMFGHNVAPHVHIFVANIYLLFPAMVNPIIYGVRTKKIRDSLVTSSNSSIRQSASFYLMDSWLREFSSLYFHPPLCVLPDWKSGQLHNSSHHPH
ncbi:hypothetical protein HPG69_006228 [Diceros bicornis minor]|uniref:G-protein coupled receptors family 1 profile domain-containing protein n=1 Tax=Diceros bicornis minor TaxID=77932 RepID=A0A7J7F2V7_DICBM|nr:hypothetical protein HPG69_006228 [Diceros bicornis minor]